VVTVIVAMSVWIVVHDEVSQVRVQIAAAGPLQRNAVTAVVLAIHDPLLVRRPLRAELPCLRPGVLCCGPLVVSEVVAAQLCPRRRPLWRKVEVKLVSRVIERLYRQDQLLAAYLNEAEFGVVRGRRVKGVNAMALAYFGKPASHLTTFEGATIVASLRAPLRLLRNGEALAERREFVLQQMNGAAAKPPHS
jgi:membrane carboxypeptidase/penicillin-binding protein PbpC